jgi:DNA-directed RNA polymerase specialized sigma24 family protein
MSPLTVRRYRAERLLRREFDGLRVRVIANVRARLRASGASLDQADLEACYAMAWQGLYSVVLEGQDVDNPAGWLTLVTYRRAIDEHRARTSVLPACPDRGDWAAGDSSAVAELDWSRERDLAAELDDHTRLRQLFEGLRGRLSAREREAATLCYLHGLSRADAAARMGVSESRMRKLMDGAGGGEQGVAGKVGVLVATISDGRWCEDQGSLMRAFAYGILDPDGQRYQLALAHHHDCPACRAYVRSLRGLAVVLPPVLLPWGLGAGALGRAGAHAGGASAGAAAGAGGAVSLSGAAGAGGAAGGGWLLGGGAFAGKLAAGCLLALSVGAGCLALSGIPDRPGAATHRHGAVHVARVSHAAYTSPVQPVGYQISTGAPVQPGAAGAPGADSAHSLAPAVKASREFGPEQALAGGDARAVSAGAAAGRAALSARSASAGSAPEPAVSLTGGGSESSDGGGSTGGAPAGEGSGQASSASSGGGASGTPSKAEREF